MIHDWKKTKRANLIKFQLELWTAPKYKEFRKKIKECKAKPNTTK